MQSAMGGRGTVGLAQSGTLVTTASGTAAPITLPPTIPNGASVLYISAATSLPRLITTVSCQQRYGNSPTGVWLNGPVVQEQFQYEDGSLTALQDAPAGVGPAYTACAPG
jgi:hypothetical protein